MVPELVRVSVLSAHTQVDLALPAAVPIAAVMGDLLAHVSSRMPPQSEGEHGESAPAQGRHRWTLAFVGQSELPPQRSLSESGVRDGDLLEMRSVAAQTAPPLFDDVVDAVAHLTDGRFASWTTTSARYTGYVVALLAGLAAAVSLAAYRRSDDSVAIAALGGGAVIAGLIAATVVARHYRDDRTATVIVAAIAPITVATGMLLAPGDYGAPHLMFGCALTFAMLFVSYRLTRVGPAAHYALGTASFLGAFAFLGHLLTSGDTAVAVHTTAVHSTAAITAFVGLLTVAAAPRLTILLAKLPLPPVPTAGAPIDSTDFAPTPAIDGIGAVGTALLPNVQALEERSVLASRYLTGIVLGAAAVTAPAAVLTSSPLAGFDAKRAAFAVIVAIVLCLRGRSHSDRTQAAGLIGAGLLVPVSMIVGFAAGSADRSLIGFVVAVALLVGALVIGCVAAGHEFTPVMRRAAEIMEYVLLLSVIPLLLWILDLYRVVREF